MDYNIGGFDVLKAGHGAFPMSGYEGMGPTMGMTQPLVGIPGVGGTPPATTPQWGAKFGGPLGVAEMGIAGLQTLGSLWMGFKQAKMAKKQFKFTKDITETNLANQMKSYNTALADRARSRGVMEGQDQGTIDSYVSNNSLGRNQARPTGYANNYREGGSTPTAASIGGLSTLAARAAAERSTRRDDEPVTRG